MQYRIASCVLLAALNLPALAAEPIGAPAADPSLALAARPPVITRELADDALATPPSPLAEDGPDETEILPSPSLSFAGSPHDSNWMAGGANPGDYVIGMAQLDGVTGGQAQAIIARPGAAPGRNGFMVRFADAAPYRGRRLRLSARLRSQDASLLQMWLRSDGAQEAFYNMADRPIKGTTQWKLYEIVPDVPQDATELNYGFGLAGGKGWAFADSFKLETVGLGMPVSQMPPPRPARRGRLAYQGDGSCWSGCGMGMGSYGNINGQDHYTMELKAEAARTPPHPGPGAAQ